MEHLSHGLHKLNIKTLNTKSLFGPFPSAQTRPSLNVKKNKEFKGLTRRVNPDPDSTQPNLKFFRVSQVRVFSSFGLKNLVQNLKFSGWFWLGLGFWVGLDFAKSSAYMDSDCSVCFGKISLFSEFM